MMSFPKRLLLSIITLLLMGFVQVPTPCQGDGMGNACTAESCTCTSICSCQIVGCSNDDPAPHGGCHQAAVEPSHSACVGMGNESVPMHFSLPRPLPQLLVTPSFRWIGARIAQDRSAPLVVSYDSPFMKVAEPPPRSMACPPLA